jgi:hypothetical protein
MRKKPVKSQEFETEGLRYSVDIFSGVRGYWGKWTCRWTDQEKCTEEWYPTVADALFYIRRHAEELLQSRHNAKTSRCPLLETQTGSSP